MYLSDKDLISNQIFTVNQSPGELGTEAEKHGWDSSSYLGTPPQHWGFHLEEGMEVQHA